MKTINKFINKDMKDSIVKLKLISGEPQIGTLDVFDNVLVMEILVPGIPTEESVIDIEIFEDSVNIKLTNEFKHVKPFDISLASECLNFDQLYCKREDGILVFRIPLFVEPTKADNKFKI